MAEIFNTYLYQPIFAVLVFIYNNLAFNDLGIAIIILTLIVRIILFPLFHKSARDQAIMQRLQPHIQKIQLDHKDNKEEQARQLLSLYQKHRFNPFSGFFLLFLQLPVLIALYQVFLKETTNIIFGSHSFLGILNLSEKSLFLAVLAALLQFGQAKLMQAPQKKTPAPKGTFSMNNKFMLFFGPALTFVILTNFPSALGLYWSASTLFSLVQQVIINRNLPQTEHDGNKDENRKNP